MQNGRTVIPVSFERSANDAENEDAISMNIISLRDPYSRELNRRRGLEIIIKLVMNGF